ncbi:hypothetical protein CGRA01v4_01012 [Colletotrichum graminicola]|uniref:Uncharacterized protein n=1 Tax=Colletotrichum graminicola (strain M1.001 / M2 / FGSC 10212) TaxID=645133 RepID=E3QGU6_COLGM|nr:uncharacterized protein GLRG_05228 [Colletotrichum graminicola M1.001]EFQ30084.1 hypothetical protein GLRG_05228 [Colletotrichum graminicola M1.001]WDK09734.1 hypothetical protein CGRA01v4_01012 [Colletotrichum graminicola]
MQQQLAGTLCCPPHIGSKARDGERGVDTRGATFRNQLSPNEYFHGTPAVVDNPPPPTAAQRPALRDLWMMCEEEIQVTQRMPSEKVELNSDCIAERLLKGEASGFLRVEAIHVMRVFQQT